MLASAVTPAIRPDHISLLVISVSAMRRVYPTGKPVDIGTTVLQDR